MARLPVDVSREIRKIFNSVGAFGFTSHVRAITLPDIDLIKHSQDSSVTQEGSITV